MKDWKVGNCMVSSGIDKNGNSRDLCLGCRDCDCMWLSHLLTQSLFHIYIIAYFSAIWASTFSLLDLSTWPRRRSGQTWELHGSYISLLNPTSNARGWTHTNVTNAIPFCFHVVYYFIMVWFILPNFLCPGTSKVCQCEFSSQKQDHLVEQDRSLKDLLPQYRQWNLP